MPHSCAESWCCVPYQVMSAFHCPPRGHGFASASLTHEDYGSKPADATKTAFIVHGLLGCATRTIPLSLLWASCFDSACLLNLQQQDLTSVHVSAVQAGAQLADLLQTALGKRQQPT